MKVICPKSGLSEEVRYRISANEVRHVDRNFDAEVDLEDPVPAMVLTAVDDIKASTEIYTLCKAKRIPVNVADVPPECDFYFGSVHRDGPLQVMVSTNGNGPKLANIVRKQIAAQLPSNLGSAIEKVGALRKMLRARAPEVAEGPKRMHWMSKVCQEWTLEELCEMDEDDMKVLLSSYGPNTVPTFTEVRLRDISRAFDGSFGWSCVI